MANPDFPQAPSQRDASTGNASLAQNADQSRLERVLTKGTLWKKQTLRNIENTVDAEQNDTQTRDHNTDKLTRMFVRLSAQLEERNLEIDQLRAVISCLENEKCQLDRVRKQELESYRKELQCLQSAYDQFEKESDSLISELGEQNDRLLDSCRYHNDRSLL